MTGRVQVLLLLRLIGFSIMGVIGIFTSTWPNAPLIVFLFLIRTGVNNAGYPIQKAVLMDYVPKVGSFFERLLETPRDSHAIRLAIRQQMMSLAVSLTGKLGRSMGGLMRHCSWPAVSNVCSAALT